MSTRINEFSVSPANEFWSGIKAEIPILLGGIPFGMIYGALAFSAGMNAGTAQAMSAVIFAGSAQFIATELIATGAPLLVVILTIAVVNLRHALYSASVAPFVRHLPLRWKLLLGYLLTDEAYAVAITHYEEESDLEQKHWFFLGAGLALWLSWQASTALGIILGAQITDGWSLDFTLALTFIALVAPLLKDRAAIMAAVTAGVLVLLLADLPLKLGLVVASIGGVILGMVVEKKR